MANSDPTARLTLRVALIEDDVALRLSLEQLIAGTPGYACVGSYGTVADALAHRLSPPPGVLLLDINLPGMSGAAGVKPLRAHYPDLDILMLTVYEDEDRIFESLLNGACGYLLKKTPPARLLEAIREARNGGAPMSSEIARKVVRLFQRVSPQPEITDSPPIEQRPTPQEQNLLALLAQGHTYQTAASAMNVSINTVRNYIRSIYQKLHVHSKSAAVDRAIRAGLI